MKAFAALAYAVTSPKEGARAPLRLAKWIREAHPPRSGALRPPVCLRSSPDLVRCYEFLSRRRRSLRNTPDRLVGFHTYNLKEKGKVP